MNHDLQKIIESKRRYREQLAARPIAEILAMLDQLREHTPISERTHYVFTTECTEQGAACKLVGYALGVGRTAVPAVAVGLAALLGVSCGATKKHDDGLTLCEMRLEVIPTNGPTFHRTFQLDDLPDLDGLAATLDHIPELNGVTGEMIVTHSFAIDGTRTPGMRMEIPLVDGLGHGLGRNFGYFEGDWHLLGELTYEHGVKQGPFALYHPLTRTKAGEGSSKDGRWDGDTVWYNPDGTIFARAHYTNGVLEGRCHVYNPTGDVIASGTYDHGTMVSGTFVDDLNKYLRDRIGRDFFEPTIVTAPSAPAPAPSPSPAVSLSLPSYLRALRVLCGSKTIWG